MSGTSLVVGAIGAFAVLFLVYGVSQTGQTAEDPGWLQAQRNDDPELPGQYYPPHPGADGAVETGDDKSHFGSGTTVPICTEEQVVAGQIGNPICYTSNPPTSGPHADQPMPFRVLQNPAPKENLLHSMEHGGVVVYYNTNNQGIVDELKDLVGDFIDRRRQVTLTSYPTMEAETIAITAWTRLDKFPVSEYENDRVRSFIEEHHKRYNPEGF